MSLKTNYLVVGTLVVLILALAGITYTYTRIISEKTVEGHQQGLVQEGAKTVELWLDHRFRITESTAATLSQIQPANDDQTLRLLKMAMKSGGFSDVYIGLADGTMIDGADWVPPKGYDPRIRPWYSRAMAENRLTLTRPYLDLTTRQMVIAIVTPLVRNGKFIGVLSSDIILDTLESSVLDLKVGESGYAFIMDNQGTVLVHPDQDLLMTTRIQETQPGLAGFYSAFRNRTTGSYYYTARVTDGAGATDSAATNREKDRQETQERMLTFQKLSDTGWYLCASVTKDEAFALAKNTAMLFAMGMVLKSLGILALLLLVVLGCSVFILLMSKHRFETIVSGKDKDLKGEISKRKEIQTRYRTLFNMATNAIMLSRNSAFIECNEKALDMFGLPGNEIIGRSMLDLSPATQQDGVTSKSCLDKVFEDLGAGKQEPFKWTFKRADGTEFPAEVGLRTLKLDSEMVTVYSIWDISKRVKAEQHLRQAQKMAAMGEMLSVIAHQWRQPLNALSTYVASLGPAFYNGMITKAFIDRVIKESDSQIQFMSRTINDFRQYFRPSKNKRPFNVLDSVTDAVKLTRPQLKQNAISLEMNLPRYVETLPVLGYENEFVHVLVNIISNAKDAINERQEKNLGLRVHRLIDLSVEQEGHEVVLVVRDSGCGIPQHLVEKIFTPYFTTKGTATGTGIGLYMAKMIVEKEMKGQIQVKNLSIGAQFLIRLPLSTIAVVPEEKEKRHA